MPPLEKILRAPLISRALNAILPTTAKYYSSLVWNLDMVFSRILLYIIFRSNTHFQITYTFQVIMIRLLCLNIVCYGNQLCIFKRHWDFLNDLFHIRWYFYSENFISEKYINHHGSGSLMYLCNSLDEQMFIMQAYIFIKSRFNFFAQKVLPF